MSIDFSDVQMVDSTGLGLLISAHNSMRKVGGRLAVIHASTRFWSCSGPCAFTSTFRCPETRRENERTERLDDELVQDYLAECREHLATIETGPAGHRAKRRGD